MLRPLLVILCLHLAAGILMAESDRWPRTLPVKGMEVVMYQPQLELFDGTKLEGRAAVSVKRPSDTAAVFGAVWISCTVNVDRDVRMVYIRTLNVTNARFPESVTDQTSLRTSIADALRADLPPLSLDELVTAMDAVNKRNDLAAQFRNDPPEIIRATSPSVLVFVDGDPRWEALQSGAMERVVNTAFAIVRTKGSATMNLYAERTWYTSKDIAGPWTATSSVSDDLRKIAQYVDSVTKATNGGTLPDRPKKTPAVIVRTKPAELLQFDGEPVFDPIAGTNLMAAKNCSTIVIMDITSQQTYVVLSGRWYRTKDVAKGPWSFVASDALPADFAKIPEGSSYDAALAYVAGTDAAREAVLDANIPQTAAVDRATAKCTVTYNGEPEFKPIEGTSMKYAVNTASSVLLIDGRYYACENGVWFESTAPKGPWTVSTKRPDKVDEIPASSPVYNTKYVYVYETTPTTVYVGYTPGYMGCYVMGPTVVYGTGYWYRPYGPYYYPYHATWGFHMSYSPYYGWSCGVRVGYGYGGYWGPPMYRPPYYYHPPYGYYGRAPYQPQRGYSGAPGGNRPSNIYGQSGPGVQPARPSTMPSTRPATRPATTPSTRPANNVMTDRSGNVYRPSNGGFEQHNGTRWQSSASAPTRDLNASQAQRDRSSMRSSNAAASRPSTTRGGGGMRGGRR